jgi:hypothetical protein
MYLDYLSWRTPLLVISKVSGRGFLILVKRLIKKIIPDITSSESTVVYDNNFTLFALVCLGCHIVIYRWEDVVFKAQSNKRSSSNKTIDIGKN